MDILVIGGGGREHAVIKALKKSRRAGKIYALPGNGGIARDAECVPVKATDIAGITEFARTHRVDFAVVTPDDPLVLGCVDALEAAGVPCFGPTADAAIIEGSKVFSKNLMKKYGIPTAASETFTDPAAALAYLKGANYPTVIKADGLALGKGAVIVNSFEEAEKTVNEMMVERVFGASGDRILVEEFLTGPEVSVLSFTDGKTVLPLLRSDLLEIMLAVRGGCLREDMVRFRKGAACCVVLASEGYPKKYDTGFAVSLPETGPDEDIYIAGAKLENGKLVTSGGRVLGAVATADSLKEAVGRAYALADKIHFENAYMRRDIGKRALAALEDR